MNQMNKVDAFTLDRSQSVAAAALVYQEVRHAYDGSDAVRGVSLEADEGEVVCLVGPSGCGKTTLLRLAAGLEELQSGQIGIGGRLVAGAGTDIPPEDRGVGFVFQDFALFPHMTVADNVRFGLGKKHRDKAGRAKEVLSRVGMADYAEAYPHQLSGGQQQRVALARALAPEPKIVLLDEPFSGLDSRLREQLRDDTLHLLKETGAAAVMVTHDPEEAMFMGDRIAVMNAGRIEQVGSPMQIYCSPKNAFVAEFFSQVNKFTGEVIGGRVCTPIGLIPVTDHSDGVVVDILVRPEALRLKPIHDEDIDGLRQGDAAKVIASRMLGRTSMVHLCLGDGTQQHIHLHSRMPGVFLPAEDEPVAIELDRAQTFVFERR
ncbi:MAG: ABC transporter ATP-binding protein [Alphaproteobacteria bacterium]|nr:ABC transporter ATP-binding protein [Alphaproteobacteria bacterium]